MVHPRRRGHTAPTVRTMSIGATHCRRTPLLIRIPLTRVEHKHAKIVLEIKWLLMVSSHSCHLPLEPSPHAPSLPSFRSLSTPSPPSTRGRSPSHSRTLALSLPCPIGPRTLDPSAAAPPPRECTTSPPSRSPRLAPSPPHASPSSPDAPIALHRPLTSSPIGPSAPRTLALAPFGTMPPHCAPSPPRSRVLPPSSPLARSTPHTMPPSRCVGPSAPRSLVPSHSGPSSLDDAPDRSFSSVAASHYCGARRGVNLENNCSNFQYSESSCVAVAPPMCVSFICSSLC